MLDQLFWLALVVSLAFGLSFTITGLLLGLLIFIFYIANLTGALFSLTVTPIGTSFQFTTRANPVLALDSSPRESRCYCASSLPWEFLGFYLFSQLCDCSSAFVWWLYIVLLRYLSDLFLLHSNSALSRFEPRLHGSFKSWRFCLKW